MSHFHFAWHEPPVCTCSPGRGHCPVHGECDCFWTFGGPNGVKWTVTLRPGCPRHWPIRLPCTCDLIGRRASPDCPNDHHVEIARYRIANGDLAPA